MRAALGQLSYVRNEASFSSPGLTRVFPEDSKTRRRAGKKTSNVLGTNGTPASLAAKHATSSIPIAHSVHG
jgi:hypothetical protein